MSLFNRAHNTHYSDKQPYDKASILKFDYGYFSLSIILLVTEIIIARYMTGWVRAYLGDILVVILIYSALMAVVNNEKIDKRAVIFATFLLAISVEFAQYFNLAQKLGFEKGSLGYIVIGNTFSIEDLICYSVGCLLILMVEGEFGLNK